MLPRPQNPSSIVRSSIWREGVRCGQVVSCPNNRHAADSGVRSPRRSLQQLYLLGHQQRPEPGREAFDEILVRIHRRPMGPAIRVVIELPEMDKLIDRPGVGLEVADELLVLPTFLECWKTNLLVELDGFGH